MQKINIPDHSQTIVAPCTAPGVAAISVIRLSGNRAIEIVNSVFKGKNLHSAPSHTLHLGNIIDGEKLIDEVVVGLFKAPKSFTKQDVVEVSCHGSPFIVRSLLNLFIQNGARMAEPGEFTLRAFLNGRFDLSQAEAVADLIHADSEASHHSALNQMRGGVADAIQKLRSDLLHFTALVELELDFGEEDVEFANRTDLKNLLQKILTDIRHLKSTFSVGNAMKNGIPVAIVGKPNAGKSTLLNRLLQEEKALVSEIPGTTRDFIEDSIMIEGFSFRFIDTAGLRETTDVVEALGVKRTHEKMASASIIIWLFDPNENSPEEVTANIASFNFTNQKVICVANKSDMVNKNRLENYNALPGFMAISAQMGIGIEALKSGLVIAANLPNLQNSGVVISNTRHFEQLKLAEQALIEAINALVSGLETDMLAENLREVLHYLGNISGAVTTDEVLGEIFGKFCIGK